MRANGVDVIAVDPLYALSNTELKQRALADLDAAMSTLSASQGIRPEFNLIACRQEHIQALDAFLIDHNTYPDRYIAANLRQEPGLDFASEAAVYSSTQPIRSNANPPDGMITAPKGWHCSIPSLK